MADADIVAPQPAPVSVQCGMARLNDGTQTVVMSIHSVNGTAVYFLPVDFIDVLINQLATAANEARGGLIVPNVFPMNGGPN